MQGDSGFFPEFAFGLFGDWRSHLGTTTLKTPSESWTKSNGSMPLLAAEQRALSIVSSLLSNSNIKLSDEIDTRRKIERFVEGGRSKIAVVTDFGRTVTTGASLSTHAIVQKCTSCPKFREESKENYDRVYPIKRDPSIPLSTKIPLMREWYNKTHALMASVGITRTMVKDVIAQRSGEDFDPGNGGIRIREGAVGEMECERGARGRRSKATTGERYDTKKSGDLPLLTFLSPRCSSLRSSQNSSTGWGS